MNSPLKLFRKLHTSLLPQLLLLPLILLLLSTRDKPINKKLQASEKWRENLDVAHRRDQKTWLLLFVASSLSNNVFDYQNNNDKCVII